LFGPTHWTQSVAYSTGVPYTMDPNTHTHTHTHTQLKALRKHMETLLIIDTLTDHLLKVLV